MALTGKAEAVASSIASQEKFEEQISDLSLDKLEAVATALDRVLEIPDEQFNAERIVAEAFNPDELARQIAADPEKAEAYRQRHRAKVDALYRIVYHGFDAYAAQMERFAKTYQKKQRAAANRARAILEQVHFTMRARGVDKIVGEDFTFERQTTRNMQHGELVYERDATPADLLSEELGKYVTEIPAYWAWNNALMKDDLKPFYRALLDQPTCQICEGRKSKVSGDELIPCEACCGTGKLLPPEIEIPAAHTVAALEFRERLVADVAAKAIKPKDKRSKKK